MPAKVKVRILAGRNLPVMDKSSDASDAFVEVKLGNTTYKTEVYRRSLNPFWNSEWFRFEVSDLELQDEPLQIRIMDYDTYSANDAIGKVYINLNPLLTNYGHSMSGWLPIYDTLHGIRGEINCVVKVNLFADNNRYRQSSCGVRFFFSDIPNGYRCDAILGFVDELLVNDDPEYQWIDKIRTPRASNEARQTLFTKLGGEVQRKLGLKAEIYGGNAVIGYQLSFDFEGRKLIGRGIGTAVVLNKIGSPAGGLSPLISIRYSTANNRHHHQSNRNEANQQPINLSGRPLDQVSDSLGNRPRTSRTLQHSASADFFNYVPNYYVNKKRMSSVTTTFTNDSLSSVNGDSLVTNNKMQLSNKISKQFNLKLGSHRKSNKTNILSIGENYLATLIKPSNKPKISTTKTALTIYVANDSDTHTTTNKSESSLLDNIDETNSNHVTNTIALSKSTDNNINQQLTTKLDYLTKIQHLTHSISNATLKSYSTTGASTTTTGPSSKTNQVGQTSSVVQIRNNSSSLGEPSKVTTTNGKSKNVSSSVSSSSMSTVPTASQDGNVNQLLPASNIRNVKYEKSLSTSTGADHLSVIEEKLDDEQHPSSAASGSLQETSKTTNAIISKHGTVSRDKEIDLSDEDLSDESSTSEQSSASTTSQSSTTLSRNTPSFAKANSKSNMSGSPISSRSSQKQGPNISSSMQQQQDKSTIDGIACLRSGSSSSSPQAASSLKNTASVNKGRNMLAHRGSLHKSDSDLSLSTIQGQVSIDDSSKIPTNSKNSNGNLNQPRYLHQSKSPPPAHSYSYSSQQQQQQQQSLYHQKYRQQSSNSSIKLRQPANQFAQSVSAVKTQQHLMQQMVKQQNVNLGPCKSNDNRNIFIHPNRIQQAEYPFVTIKKYPDGMIQSIGGVVSVHSVKLLHIINDVESEKRDTWWTEIRKEIKSHAKSLNCNTILGYRETSRIREDVCILSASGTAAVLRPTPIICPQDQFEASNYSSSTIQSDHIQATTNKLDAGDSSTKLESAPLSNGSIKTSYQQQTEQPSTRSPPKASASPSQNTSKPDCSLCHTPLTCLNSISSFADCTICHKSKVPDVLLFTIEPPSNLNTASIGTLVQARVCRNKRDSHGEVSAKEVDDALPFLEYELHRQLLSKLKFMGMNCLYGLTVDISVGENMLTGVATGTGCFVLGLPAPDPPQISAGKGIKASKLSEIQRIISVSAIKNREHYGLNRFYDNIIPTIGKQPNSATLLMGTTTASNSISTNNRQQTDESTLKQSQSSSLLRASSSSAKGPASSSLDEGKQDQVDVSPTADGNYSTSQNQNKTTTTGSEFRSLDRSLSSNYQQHSSSSSPPHNEQSATGGNPGQKQQQSGSLDSGNSQQNSQAPTLAPVHQSIQAQVSGSNSLNNTIVLEVDDNEDADIIALMIDSEVPYGYFVCNSETYPSLQPSSISSINMFTQVMRAKLTGIKQFAQQFDWIIQSLFVKLRRSLPCCLTNIKFVVDLPEADIVQIAVTGCLIGLQQPNMQQQASCSNDILSNNEPTSSNVGISKQHSTSAATEPNGSKNNKQMSSSSLSPSSPSSTSASSNSLSTTTSSSTTSTTTTTSSTTGNSQLNSSESTNNKAKLKPMIAEQQKHDTNNEKLIRATSKGFLKKKQALVKAGQELKLKLSELSNKSSNSSSSNANDNKDTSPDFSDHPNDAVNRVRNKTDESTFAPKANLTSPNRTVFKKQATYPGAIASIVSGQEPLEHRVKLAQQVSNAKYKPKKFQLKQRQQQVTISGSPTLTGASTKSPVTAKKIASDRDTIQAAETIKTKKKSTNYQRQQNNQPSANLNSHPTGGSTGKRRGSVQFGTNSSKATNGFNGGAHETLNSNIDITSLSYIPGATDYHYLGNLSFSFVRETNSVRENGGLNGFIHCFLMEVYAIVRAHVSALGGNAFLSFRLQQFCVIYHSNKNQAQCLISVAGDAAHISH